MRRFAHLVWVSSLLLACGGESDSDPSGSGGASSGGVGGSTSGGAGGSGNSTSGGASGSGGSTSGGAAGSGGSTSGGAAGSGGSTSGGAAGSGGSTSGGTGGGGAGGTGGALVAAPECNVDSDCKVFEDCCSCDGIPTSQNPGICKLGCTTKKCAALGVSATEVSCVAGRCVKGYDCDSSKVVCLTKAPNCPAGEVAQIKGNCWSGACVPAGECTSVASCSDCTSAKYACVTYVAKPAPVRHCVDIPLPCAGASCACFGPSVCTGSFNICNDLSGIKGVTCGCPTC